MPLLFVSSVQWYGVIAGVALHNESAAPPKLKRPFGASCLGASCFVPFLSPLLGAAEPQLQVRELVCAAHGRLAEPHTARAQLPPYASRHRVGSKA